MNELYPEADQMLGLNIGGDEFPNGQQFNPDFHKVGWRQSPEHKAKVDKMTNDWMAQRWGNEKK